MSDKKTVNIEINIDDEAQEGMEMLTEVIEIQKTVVRDSHLLTREEILEAYSEFVNLIEIIFIAGQANIETQMLIQEVEGTQK